MDASINGYCAPNVAKEECLEVGLEGIATSQRIGLDAGARAERIGHHSDGTVQRMAIAELDAVERVAQDVCDSSRDILRDIHQADNHVTSSVERHGLHNGDKIERTADKTQNDVERFGLSNRDAIERESRHLDASIERQAYRTQEELEKFGLRSIESTHSAEKYLYAGMSANAREILLKMCDDTASIKTQSASQFKDLLMQNCQDAKDAALAARDLMHQADKNTSAIQLEAFRHKEELARQIAECCCEQKSLTIEKANDTQQLLRELDKERIRDELAKTREELIALRVRSTLTPALVGSVPL